MSVRIRKTKRPYRDHLAWMWLRNRFIALRAATVDITLREFAEKHGIVLKTLENRCQTEKWFEEVERLRRLVHIAAELIRLHGLSPDEAVRHAAGFKSDDRVTMKHSMQR